MQFPHCLSSTVSVCDIPFGTKPYIFLQCLQCHLPQFQVNDVPADPTCYQQLCQVFEGHHQLLFPLKYKTKLRVNQLKITSLLVNYFDPVPILQSLIANDFLSRGGEGGGGRGRVQAFLQCQRFSIRYSFIGRQVCNLVDLVVLGTSYPPCYTMDCS